ncbi:MAG: hypothetical protein UT17_C0005G0042 [Candidatus Woesebacteria bacterium GW2011_GWB1_39_10]|uniref:SpoVT-AbrB domain-containing protein n=1 Tax=Candidatus Woesebacteria bacterium GW2011_GWB1_39_10 TaxID=1618572 RepID=A0A0G0P0K0_9BACT|nr:MAG: hypothetical protein UT17_C0005G0042 [Candidatus Woesebacteria bacterium GW2011_GWB1_39_10]
MTYTIDIRPRRQATFPSAVLTALGLTVGDSIQIKVENGKAILTPQKQVALDALAEIQRAFKNSKITEEDLMKEVNEQRFETAKLYSKNK